MTHATVRMDFHIHQNEGYPPCFWCWHCGAPPVSAPPPGQTAALMLLPEECPCRHPQESPLCCWRPGGRRRRTWRAGGRLPRLQASLGPWTADPLLCPPGLGPSQPDLCPPPPALSPLDPVLVRWPPDRSPCHGQRRGQQPLPEWLAGFGTAAFRAAQRQVCPQSHGAGSVAAGAAGSQTAGVGTGRGPPVQTVPRVGVTGTAEEQLAEAAGSAGMAVT